MKNVAGLYPDPPENAIICVDEKSQIQALERSQPVRHMIRNVPERQSVDYFRHGTTTLFAVLDVLNGKAIGECNTTHAAKYFTRLLGKWTSLRLPQGIAYSGG